MNFAIYQKQQPIVLLEKAALESTAILGITWVL